MTSFRSHPLEDFGRAGETLLRTLAARRLSPSYLFEGLDGETLHAAALAFAAGILSASPPEALDSRATRLALAESHPDLHVLTKDKATVISVKALASVLERAHQTPLEAEHQVFLVDPAEAMEPAGIARYLKSLEEPPEGTVFLLVTTRPERLPDTVLSRCRRTRFPPMQSAALTARLVSEGIAEDDARNVCRCAGGALARARRMARCGVVPTAHDLLAAAASKEPRVAATVEEALAHLRSSAADLAALDPDETDTKRQHVRTLIADVLRVLCVEARECAAGRTSRLSAQVGSDGALDLLGIWGELDAAVAANVTPAAVLIDAVAALRRRVTPSRQAH